MSTLTAYDALRDWFEANWTFTAKRYENETPYAPADLAPFVYMEVEGELFSQLSIGAGAPSANLWREEGAAWFHCCVPQGSGVETARSYAQTLALMLKGLALAPGLQMTSMQIRPGGPYPADGNYYAVPLLSNWYRNEPAVA